MRCVPTPTILWRTCLALSCLTASTYALATPTGARFHRPPPSGDDYLAWTKRSMALMHAYDLGDVAPFHPDAEWMQEYLADPASIYSDLHPRLFSGDRSESPDATAFPESKRTARAIAWDLGLDKALPGYQVLPDYPGPTQGNLLLDVAANLDKAGVDFIYFQKAYALGGNDLYALNAEVAVALQTLHTWVETTPWAERDGVGIDEDALQRVMSASSLDDVSDHDLTYLADILRAELTARSTGASAPGGLRALPTPLRIARVAAAYRASNAGYAACQSDGARKDTAGTIPEDIDRPICFTDATDRAVYRWYRAMRRFQLARQPEAFHGDFGQVARWIDHFADVRPAWAGAYTDEALDWSNHAEVVEAQLALDSDSSGENDIAFYRLVERANLLVCRTTAR